MDVNGLYKNGVLKEMLNRRMISTSTYRSVEIFLEVKNQEMKGVKRTRAVEAIALTMPGKAKPSTKKRAVWAAIKSIEGDKNS